MNKKIFENSRFCPKGDTEANWNKAVGFVPLDKEIIIYKKDENHPVARIKVGDGVTSVQDLPFVADEAVIEKLIDEKGKLLIEYVDNAVSAIPQADWNQNNETTKDYIKNRPFYEDEPIIVDVSALDYGLNPSRSYYDTDGNVIYRANTNPQWKPFSYEKDLNLELINIIGINRQISYDSNMNQVKIDTEFQMTGQDALKQQLIKWAIPSDSDTSSCWVCKRDDHGFDMWGGARVTFIIYENIKTIDEKFIPDTIVRIDEIPEVDQVYNAESKNAQSGVAVAEAINQAKAEFNLQNGEGKYSLKQRNVEDEAESSFQLKNPSSPNDKSEFKREVTGKSSALLGSDNSVAVPNAIVGGDGNVYDGAAAGRGIQGGRYNHAQGDDIIQVGSQNYTGSSRTLQTGNLNKIKKNSYDSAMSGSQNTIGESSPNSTIDGLGNEIKDNCPFSRESGRNNKVNTPNQAVDGYFNKENAEAIYMVGNGDMPTAENGWKMIRKNAFEVLRDGRAKVQSAPQDADDVIRKKELDKKFDKTGGTISGNVSIQGNLSVSGETTTLDTVTLQVKDNVIVANADGAELVENAGFAMKTSATSAYGIMYDPVGDGVKIGLGAFDANGKFEYAQDEAQFLATRADDIVDNHTVVWDSEKRTFVDSGVDPNQLVTTTYYASTSRAGLVKDAGEQYGLTINPDNGNISLAPVSDKELVQKTGGKALKIEHIDKVWKIGATTNAESWSEEEKAAARSTIGAAGLDELMKLLPRVVRI